MSTPSLPGWPELEVFEAALAKLPLFEREALLLATREQMPNDAIAHRLALTTAKVEDLITRALLRLDRDLAP